MSAPWMFDKEQSEVLGRIAGINNAARQRYRETIEARDELADKTVTVRSDDGVVCATVSSSGGLRDLELNHRVRTWSHDQIAKAVLNCVQRAQAKLADTAQEVFASHLSESDDPSVTLAVRTLRGAFPEPAPTGRSAR